MDTVETIHQVYVLLDHHKPRYDPVDFTEIFHYAKTYMKGTMAVQSLKGGMLELTFENYPDKLAIVPVSSHGFLDQCQLALSMFAYRLHHEPMFRVSLFIYVIQNCWKLDANALLEAWMKAEVLSQKTFHLVKHVNG